MTSEKSQENFERWFASSKIVDAAGAPLVLHHGTAGEEFDTFRPRTARAVWFAFDQRYAQKYADSRAADNKRTIAVQLALDNPLIKMRVKPRPSGRGRKARSDIENVAAMAD